MLKETKDYCAKENISDYFSIFNHKFFENPLDYHDYQENQQKEYLNNLNTYSKSIEGEGLSTNSSNQSFNSLDNEENLIPLNLLDLSPIKIQFDFPETKITSQKKLHPKNKQKEEKKNGKKSKNKEIHPELQKYILPKSLFSKTKNKNKNNEIKENKKLGYTSNNNNLNLFNKSYTTKCKDYSCFINDNDGFYFLNKIENNFVNFHSINSNIKDKI